MPNLPPSAECCADHEGDCCDVAFRQQTNNDGDACHYECNSELALADSHHPLSLKLF